jgi:hypothetical protein
MTIRSIEQQIPITIGFAQSKIEIPEGLLTDSHFPIKGIAIVAHPHPLMGGTMENKVAVTLAKTLNQLGFITIRFNFRGVGKSTGVHDHGIGETQDLEEILALARSSKFWESIPETQSYPWVSQISTLPYVLAGFSFGTFVSSRLVASLQEDLPQRLILVGTACGKWDVPNVPANTIIIHGELDETILLSDVFEWARTQELLVQVIPGADHFFHRKLHCIRQAIFSAWYGVANRYDNT